MDLPPDFKDLLEELARDAVECLLIGGYAVALHGRPRATKDIDVFLEGSATNLERAARALGRFGAPANVVAAVRSMAENEIVFMGSPPLRVDFLRSIDGVTPGELFAEAVLADLDGVPVKVISIAHLIAKKRAAGRPKDLIDADFLEKGAPRQTPMKTILGLLAFGVLVSCGEAPPLPTRASVEAKRHAAAEAAPAVLTVGDILALEGNPPPATTLTVAQARRDVDVLRYLLERAYVGSLPAVNRLAPATLQALDAIRVSPPLVAADLCRAIDTALAHTPDGHLRAYLGGWTACSRTEAPWGEVGKNLAKALTRRPRARCARRRSSSICAGTAAATRRAATRSRRG